MTGWLRGLRGWMRSGLRKLKDWLRDGLRGLGGLKKKGIKGLRSSMGMVQRKGEMGRGSGRKRREMWMLWWREVDLWLIERIE